MFTDIARFGEEKLDLLRRSREFSNGASTHGQLGEIFTAIPAQAPFRQRRDQRPGVADLDALAQLTAAAVPLPRNDTEPTRHR
jgi:hypothetical protein